MVTWSRAELKNRGRAAVERNYWKYVLTSLILGIVTSGGFTFSYRFNIGGINNTDFEEFDSFSDFYRGFHPSGMFLSIFVPMIIMFFLLLLVVSFGLRIFAFHPIECGCQRVFVMGQRYQAYLGNISWPMTQCYKNVVKIQFFRYLYTFLWSLLFLIPGIIKSYEYRMIPYILAEHPDISMEDAFRLSKAMMYGDKWNAFVLDLSFIGWNFLCLLTCFVLRIFYIGPYQNATNAELYTVLTWKLAPTGSASPVPPNPAPGSGFGGDPFSSSPTSGFSSGSSAAPGSDFSSQTTAATTSEETFTQPAAPAESPFNTQASAAAETTSDTESPFTVQTPPPVAPHFEDPAPEAQSLSSSDIQTPDDPSDKASD